ncbi:hypothetical protein ABGB19_15155 [Mycobacterium sp. B14F4]|uniref:hypothetical protein n=1 Tax=Mycobacterium sp. B14F4 TaxID=3153565 RepID=UPI00325C9C34
MNRLLSTGFGLVMLAAAALQADAVALTVCGVGVAAVLIGNVFRPMATVAVLSAGVALVLSDAVPMLAAVCGLSAAAYLVLRHAAASVPTVIGALGFTVIGLAAVALPLQLPWVPLAAPLLVLALVVSVSRPFWLERARGSRIKD